MAQLATQRGPGGVSALADDSIEATIRDVAAELALEHPAVSPLEGGAANRSFRLRDARHDYVLRIQGDASSGLGASGTAEWTMQSLAAAARLAPAIVLSKPSHGILVVTHVAGSVPGFAGFRQPDMLKRVGTWIARLHALIPPPGLAVVDFGARAAAYLARLDAQSPDPLTAEVGRRLELRRAALPPAGRLAACHHDLHHRNFVNTGDALCVVDWEYAGPGDTAADLAACIGYHELDAAGVDALLAGYGQDSAELRTRIAALGWVFDCLWFGWNACAESAGLPIEAGLQARLTSRLMR